MHARRMRLTFYDDILQSLGDMDGDNNWDCEHVRSDCSAEPLPLVLLSTR